MQKIKRGNSLVLTAICFTIVVLAGCMKASDSSYTNTDKNAYVAVMNLTSRLPAIEMYLNSTKVTNPISSNNFFALYSAVTPSNYSVDFKKASSDSVMASVPAALYDSAEFYTILAYRDSTSTMKAIRIHDDFTVLTTDKFYFRFFNMSPEIGPVNFYIDNDKVGVNRWPADNATYGDYNQFLGYAPGYHNVTVKTAGTDSVVATASSFTFEAGNAYTIFLRGAPNGSGRDGIAIDVFKAAK